MSSPVGVSAPAFGRSAVPAFPSVALSADAAPFTPGRADSSLSDAEKQFSRCAAKLWSLRADCGQLREELNQLFDQLLSENYNKSCELPITIRPEVIMDERTLDVLVNYTTDALKQCSTWTHSDVLLALSTVVYGNGSQCHQVRLCALQVLSAILDGSRQFLAAAEDTASPRTSYTPFSFMLAAAIRELHRGLSLALLAETSSQTLTQVIKLLLQQPESLGSGSISGSVTPQDPALSWRHRNGASLPVCTPAASSQHNSSTHSPHLPHTPREEENSSLWLLRLCVSLVTQPREDQSDSEGAGGGVALEPSPVRLEALQVLSHLVRGYFPLAQSSMYEIGQVVGFWSEVLSGPLNTALQNEQHPTLQASACDTLASILPQAFAQLLDAFSALCHVVTSCENFKVRIKSAAALAVPAQRSCYGDTKRFICVWSSLSSALENSEDAVDFLEYRYSTSLRHTLSQALLHLLSLSKLQDMPELSASLAGEEGRGIKEHLIKYLKAEEGEEKTGGEDEAREERNSGEESNHPQQRVGGLQQTLVRLKGLEAEEEGGEEKEVVVCFLEDLLQICEEL
ncbi:hypothetical protein GOODEAATRI_007003 [Goodea atripinnis]|uniref:DUF4042 domain-containing protein n=1 Tax=Goodea atripinnis TaxID=208336 RepID=A0ABV0PC07_9TELE